MAVKVKPRRFPNAETHFPAVPRCQAETLYGTQCKMEARWPESFITGGPKVWCTMHSPHKDQLKEAQRGTQ